MTGSTASLSGIERAELAIVEALKPRLGNDVRIEAQPDDPDKWSLGEAEGGVIVHFAESRPAATGGAVRLAGKVGFAVIVLSRGLRGPEGGYALLERTEQALAGEAPQGLRAIRILRTRLEGQAGGLWRWIVEIETELVRRAPRQSAAAPFIAGFKEQS